MKKPSRWRPACPECGYSLRGLSHTTRCPECGIEFPSLPRAYRRWAQPRLAWDRAQRSGWLMPYLRTVATIVFCPCRAGGRLVLPDRMGRAIRWAASHIVVAAVAGMLVSHGRSVLNWWIHRFRANPFDHPYFVMREDAPADRALLWMAQSVAAWCVYLLLPIAVGVLISLLMPRRHRLARWAGVKWTLYSSIVVYCVLSGWYVFHNAFPPMYMGNTGLTIWFTGPAPEPALWLPGSIFALWWAAGLAAHAYENQRFRWALLRYLLAYEVVWLVSIQFLFAPGALGELR